MGLPQKQFCLVNNNVYMPNLECHQWIYLILLLFARYFKVICVFIENQQKIGGKICKVNLLSFQIRVNSNAKFKLYWGEKWEPCHLIWLVGETNLQATSQPVDWNIVVRNCLVLK